MTSRKRSFLTGILVLTVLAALLQTGCLFRKKPKTPKYPTEPIRIALLPFNVPSDNAELRWVSLAGPILAAKELEQAKDLDLAPLWETFPAVIETLGNSRTITPENAAVIAVRLNVRWVTQTDLTPGQNGFDLRLDFIPGKATLIPFRYESSTQIDSLTTHLHEAIEQFLRYMVARPMGHAGKSMDVSQLKELSAALDREYGWFESANPGKAVAQVQKLTRSDGRLARLLFSPTLYPGAEGQPANSSSKPPAATASPQ